MYKTQFGDTKLEIQGGYLFFTFLLTIQHVIKLASYLGQFRDTRRHNIIAEYVKKNVTVISAAHYCLTLESTNLKKKKC